MRKAKQTKPKLDVKSVLNSLGFDEQHIGTQPVQDDEELWEITGSNRKPLLRQNTVEDQISDRFVKRYSLRQEIAGDEVEPPPPTRPGYYKPLLFVKKEAASPRPKLNPFVRIKPLEFDKLPQSTPQSNGGSTASKKPGLSPRILDEQAYRSSQIVPPPPPLERQVAVQSGPRRYIEPTFNVWAQYGDSPSTPTVSSTEKTIIDLNSHNYWLQDINFAYAGNLVSASSTHEYWEQVLKKGNGKIPLTREENPFAMKLKEQKGYKMAFAARTVYTNYLNGFKPPKNGGNVSYKQRSLAFADCVLPETTHTYKTIIRHCVFEQLEYWIRGDIEALGCDIEMENVTLDREGIAKDWWFILRCLRDKKKNFSGITAKNNKGEPLGFALGILALHLNARYGLDTAAPMTDPEITKMYAETSLKTGKDVHSYLEWYFKGREGAPVELKEREYYRQIYSFIEYCRKHKYTVDPRDAEKCVGSYLYKMVGMMDGLFTKENGQKFIVDYKTGINVLEEFALKTSTFDRAYSGSTNKWRLQMAHYHFTTTQEDPEIDLSPVVLIPGFNPELGDHFYPITIDLSKASKIPVVKLGNLRIDFPVEYNPKGTHVTNINALQWIGMFAEHRLDALQKAYLMGPENAEFKKYLTPVKN